MKKHLLQVLILLLLLTLFGCGKSDNSPKTTEITDISQCIISDETGRHLLLPISGRSIPVGADEVPYLEEIDLKLLKAAEEKIYTHTKEYTDHPDILLSKDHEGHLCLVTELIVPLPPEEIKEDEACGDHKHIYLQEKITK